jgi:hypothetical protein
MTRRLFVRILLCLGLLLGQAAAVVHATQHELAPHGDAACQICAIAHGAGGIPAPVVVVVDEPLRRVACALLPGAVHTRRVLVCPPSTGLPPILV